MHEFTLKNKIQELREVDQELSLCVSKCNDCPRPLDSLGIEKSTQKNCKEPEERKRGCSLHFSPQSPSTKVGLIVIPQSRSFFTIIPHPELLSSYRFLSQHHTRCQDFGESCFPSSSQIPYPVKIFCVFPNPVYTLPDPQRTEIFYKTEPLFPATLARQDRFARRQLLWQEFSG